MLTFHFQCFIPHTFPTIRILHALAIMQISERMKAWKLLNIHISLKRFKLSVLNVLCACDEIGFYCSLLWNIKDTYLKTIPIKDMINLWSIAQMVLELLDCPFVHGQLWRKIRKKTKRVREWSSFHRFRHLTTGLLCVRFRPAESLEMAHHENHSQYFYRLSVTFWIVPRS